MWVRLPPAVLKKSKKPSKKKVCRVISGFGHMGSRNERRLTMCVEHILMQTDDPKDYAWKVGYKVGKLDKEGNFYSNCYIVPSHVCGYLSDNINALELNIVHVDKNTNRIHNSYPAGFHIWKDYQIAKFEAGTDRQVFRVKYRKVVARGRQPGYIRAYEMIGDVVVAREIIIEGIV